MAFEPFLADPIGLASLRSWAPSSDLEVGAHMTSDRSSRLETIVNQSRAAPITIRDSSLFVKILIAGRPVRAWFVSCGGRTLRRIGGPSCMLIDGCGDAAFRAGREKALAVAAQWSKGRSISRI